MQNLYGIDIEKTRVVKTIAEYHGIYMSQDLMAVWMEDFCDCSVMDIKGAWNQWRKDGHKAGKKPTSVELLSLINKKDKVYKELKYEPKEVPLVKGVDYLQDRLIADLDVMNKNEPELMKKIEEASTVGKKVKACAEALGNEELLGSPLIKVLEKNFAKF